MRCVVIDANGFVVDVDPQPVDVSTCVLVLAAPSEVGASPFTITRAEMELILPGLMLLMVTGFCFRAIARALA